MMKGNARTVACGIAFLPFALTAGPSSVLDGGWRVSAGAVYDSGVKTDVQFAPRQEYVSPYSRTPGAMSRRQAEEAAWGKQTGTRTTYVNTRKGNAVSRVDSTDASSGYDVGHDEGKTMNYRFPIEVWDAEDSAFELGYAKYEDISTAQASDVSKMSEASDESAMPGVSVQISRNLYHDDDNDWGVELALGVQYARRNNVFKAGSSWQNGHSTRSTGFFRTSYRPDAEMAELLSDPDYHDYAWNCDEQGDFAGADNDRDYAAPIDLDDIRNEWGGGTESHSDSGSLYATGDYDNLELMLMLQPYYDVFNWLSVNATLGMVVSRQSMEMSFSMLRNGRLEYGRDSDFSQWDVYGVAGLGVMLYYKDITLSGDFLARFFDREMDVSDTYYKGTVSRGDWMFRLGLGYEF